MRLARGGSEDAFRRLYRDLFPPVSRYVETRVGHTQDAEDITAGVFRRFVQQLDRFDAGKGSVMTFVLAMTRNAIIDHYRRRRPSAADVHDLADVLAGTGPEPLQTLIRAEDLRTVRAAIARQPAEVREMFSLRFDQGLRVREVAEVMGLTHDAAKQRFARSLRRLQRELTDDKQTGKGESPCPVTD